MIIINVILPLAMLVAVGFFTARINFFLSDFYSGLGKFVLYFSLPSVILINLSQIDIGISIEINFIIIYALAGLSTIMVSITISKKLLKCTWQESFINALGSGVPNSAFIGFPVVLSLFDSRFVEAFLMCVLVENLILIPLCLVCLEVSSGKKSSYTKKIKGILSRVSSNPIILAIIWGLVINLINVQFPDSIMHSIDLLAQTSIALALFSIGGALSQSFELVDTKRILSVASIKLVLFPIFSLIYMAYFPMSSDLKNILLIFCAAPMITIYPILGGIYGHRNFCTNALIITTLASGITLSFIVTILN